MQRPQVAVWIGLSLLATSVAAGNSAFFGDPPDAHHPWAVHDQNRPQPPRVEPGASAGEAPSDAVVLFAGDAGDLENWVHAESALKRKKDWIVSEGALVCVPGAGHLLSRESFGDCQLHLEWSAPLPPQGEGQGRGNSGVFLMDRVEVQILDNYQNPTYADGFAAAVYGVMPPAANALRPPGEWQQYDIIFRRPIVRDGVVEDPGSLTVICNGVVVQDGTALEGGGGWKERQPLDRVFPESGPIKLQDHRNAVRFRNIWVRPLRPRALDGGTDGRLSVEATMAKRAGIAATIRRDAQDLEGTDRALRLYESLLYESHQPARVEADQLTRAYLDEVLALKARRGERGRVLTLEAAFEYMDKHGVIEADHFALTTLRKICKAEGWSTKR